MGNGVLSINHSLIKIINIPMNHLNSMIASQLKYILMFLLVLITKNSIAQYQIGLIPRESPDKKVAHKVGFTEIEITYGSPSVKGRQIWGELEPYDKVWRAGANNATTMQFSSDVWIQGNHLPKGKYAFFVIPRKENQWTLIFNKDANQWGAFKYDEIENELTIAVEYINLPSIQEQLIYTIEQVNFNQAIVSLEWESIKLSFTVETNYEKAFIENITSKVKTADQTSRALIYLQGAEHLVRIEKELSVAKSWINESKKAFETLNTWDKRFYPKNYVEGHRLWIEAQIEAKQGDFKSAISIANQVKSTLYYKEKNQEFIDQALLEWNLFSQKPEFHFEAAEAYFKLIEQLEACGKITQNQWDEFLSLRGNQLYISENQISVSYLQQLKETIESIYQKDSQLNSENESLFLKSRWRYKNEHEALQEHLQWLKSNQRLIIKESFNRAKQFVQYSSDEVFEYPNVYYHALDFDGSANEKGIFISILGAYDNNQYRLGNYEAHELHHLIRKSLLKDLPILEKDKGLLWALDAILNEGIADLVDKDIILSKDSTWWLKDIVNDYYMSTAKKAIYDLDQLILDEINGNHHKESKYRIAVQNSVGHIPGYYMAKLIQEKGFEEKLIEISNNPFAFILLYQDVAESNHESLPLFQPESINYLKDLQEYYLR